MYEVTGVFSEFRIDHETIKARSEKEAKRIFKNRYQKKYRKDVKGIKVGYSYPVG